MSAVAAVVLLALPPAGGSKASANADISATDCTISGSPGDDVITGTSGEDVICGLEGNDRIDAESGDDVLVGGAGDDELDGDEGNDWVSYEIAADGIVADLGSGSSLGEGGDQLVAVENMVGSANDDVLTGNPAGNTLSGLGGTDLLFGAGGADTVLGGDGEDYLVGSVGSVLDGGEGSDTCEPEADSVTEFSCFQSSPADENDTHGFLDVKQVDSFLDTQEPVWKVVTISKWSAFKMWDQGFVLVYLDTFGADVADYYALIRSVGTRLRGTLYRNTHKVAELQEWRRNPRSVSIRIPLEKLLVGEDRHFFRWRVVTLTDRCRHTCFDRIPDEGALVQPLPAFGD
ncbi:MAG TPA: calcium-binding protein [Actinomycetota bacterium]|nr:calcium-binding protein [Actinomycetota bacterium]